MKIFSVTALIFLTHSLSFTTGTWASRTRSGMGPAEKKNGFEMRKGEMQFYFTVGKKSQSRHPFVQIYSFEIQKDKVGNTDLFEVKCYLPIYL